VPGPRCSAAQADQVQLGAELAAARSRHQLSQQALQERAGVQQAEISRIERGVGNPTAATLLRLAGALGHKLTPVPAEASGASPEGEDAVVAPNGTEAEAPRALGREASADFGNTLVAR
jgi:transcriptional regulator with XRE-family HTH domain